MKILNNISSTSIHIPRGKNMKKVDDEAIVSLGYLVHTFVVHVYLYSVSAIPVAPHGSVFKI